MTVGEADSDPTYSQSSLQQEPDQAAVMVRLKLNRLERRHTHRHAIILYYNTFSTFVYIFSIVYVLMFVCS